MNVEIQTMPAKARCYKCGSPDIKGICHHCGRGVCKDHSHIKLPVRLGLWNTLLVGLGIKSLDHKDFSGYEPGFSRLNVREEIMMTLKLAKIDNIEFGGYVFEPNLRSDIGLFEKFGYELRKISRKINLMWGNEVGSRIASPVHCEFCVHNVSRYSTLMWLGLILTITVIGAPIGLLLLVLGFILNRVFYIQAMRDKITSIPIEGKIGKVRIEEEFSADIELDGSGKYSTRIDKLSGNLTVPIRFDITDYRNYQAFKLRAEDISAGNIESLPLDIGFMRIGGASWEFTSGDICMLDRVNIIQLRTTRQNDQFAKMVSSQEQSGGIWNVENSYYLNETVVNELIDSKLPVQTIVSILSESNRQTLDIDIELINPRLPGAMDGRIEQFTLFIPNVVGKIERVEPEGKIDESASDWPIRSGKYQSITWKKLSFKNPNPNLLRRSVYIQFKEPLIEEVGLEGELSVAFPAALSGTQQPEFFLPSGELRGKQPHEYKATTQLVVSTDLDLSGLRYQKNHIEEKTVTREGVVPDSNLISEIIKVLGEGDFYVKRVTENPAQISKEGAHKINRYWDIAGRKYEGVYPIDFHLVLTGEVIGTKERYIAGQLKVEISVQGAITNEEMVARVKNVSVVLDKLTCEALDKVPLVSAPQEKFPQPSLHYGIEDTEFEEVVRTQGTPVQVIEDDESNIEILQPLVNGKEIERVRIVQRRLDYLEDRLLEGKISEELYIELKIKYEHELWELSDGTLGRQAKESLRRQGRRR